MKFAKGAALVLGACLAGCAAGPTTEQKNADLIREIREAVRSEYSASREAEKQAAFESAMSDLLRGSKTNEGSSDESGN